MRAIIANCYYSRSLTFCACARTATISVNYTRQ